MSEGSWEERMAARARQHQVDEAARTAAAEARALSASRLSTGDPDWLNGWPSIDGGRRVLMGSAVRCICCGRDQGTTSVAISESWQAPGPEPVWPFGLENCPLCAAEGGA